MHIFSKMCPSIRNPISIIKNNCSLDKLDWLNFNAILDLSLVDKISLVVLMNLKQYYIFQKRFRVKWLNFQIRKWRDNYLTNFCFKLVNTGRNFYNFKRKPQFFFCINILSSPSWPKTDWQIQKKTPCSEILAAYYY